VEANSIPNAGMRARRNYYHTPSTHTKRNCTTITYPETTTLRKTSGPRHVLY